MAHTTVLSQPATPPHASIPITSTPDFITTSRLIPRLQASILPSSLPHDAEKSFTASHIQPVPFQIKANPYHRSRLLYNLEHARTLLLRLEHGAQSVKIQSQKREAQKKISDWRAIIRGLKAEVEEWARIYGDDAWYQDGVDFEKEDILAKYGSNKRRRTDNVSDSSDNYRVREKASGNILREGKPIQNISEDHSPVALPTSTSSDPHSPSAIAAQQSQPQQSTRLLRRRRGLRSPSPSSSPTRAHTTSASHDKNATTLSSDQALTRDATTQLALTESMSRLATQLRLSAQSFSNLLTIATRLLDAAAEGMEKNSTGMEVTGKRMGMLKRMSEGEGWWGRMMLYAWILGLWILMIVVVGIGPKFRF